LDDDDKWPLRHSYGFGVLATAMKSPWFLIACCLCWSCSNSQAQEPLRIVHREDVVYGQVQGAGLLADIAWPDSKTKLPAIISVHGGRWKASHKRDASTIKVDQWAGFGFFAMSLDYRLVGCTPAPACYQDFQCAIRYVHAQAGEYNVDASRIFLIGQSAGISCRSRRRSVTARGRAPAAGRRRAMTFAPRSALRLVTNCRR
jgi:poly(3-hydroxybutyrate) depolymerase